MITNQAMIVRLSVSQWSARKFDRKVTERANAEFEASSEAGRYNKMLVAKESLSAVTKAVSAIRTFHYENTLPWDDAGGRLLPTANFEDYRAGLRDRKDAFESAVREFIKNYPEYRESAVDRLGRMFDVSDYPGVSDIRSRFDVGFDIEPVPQGKDFRVKLEEDDIENVRAEIDKLTTERIERATRDLFERLETVIGKFAEKMADSDAIFRDSLVENIAELASLLPKLNLTGDKELAKIAKEAVSKLCAAPPDVLRDDAPSRKKAEKDANAILKKLAGYTG